MPSCCRPLAPGSQALVVPAVRFPAALIPASNPVLVAFLCCSFLPSSPLAWPVSKQHFMIWHLEAGVESLLCTSRPGRKNGSSKFFHSPFIRPVRYAARPVHTWTRRAGRWAPRRFRAVAEGALQGWLSRFFPGRMRRVLVSFQMSPHYYSKFVPLGIII